MKKLFLSFVLLMLISIYPASADGLMVHDAGLNSANDVSYLSVYENTQVTDIVFSGIADGDVMSRAIAETTKMGLNPWYMFEINSAEDFVNVDINTIPDGVYGIEFDFMSDASFVQNGHAGEIREKINAKMREIRKGVPNHKISVKVPANDVTAYDNGLDIYTWSDEGLTDYILVSPYYNGAETDISLDMWRKIIKSDIKIAGVIGTYMNIPVAENRMITLENAAALANVYFSSGADKVYFDNFRYKDSELTYEPFGETEFANKSAADTMLRECGSIKSLRTLNKRFTAANSSAPGNHSSSQNYNPLPIINSGSNFSSFRIKTGELADTSNVKFLIGFSRTDGKPAESGDITVFLNSNKLTYDFTADGTYLKSDMSGGSVFVYSVDSNMLNKINQIIELKSNIYDSGNRVPITVDFAEIRESANGDVFIYRNMSDGETDSQTGRKVMNAAANTTYTYNAEIAGDGIYALTLCYKADSEVNVTVNGRTYTLPAQKEYAAYGFAALNLKSGSNQISFTNDAAVSYNYFMLYKTDTYITKNGEELLTLENGQIVVNAKLHGLLKGQKLILSAALYNGDKLEKVYYDKQTADTDNYTMTMPIDVDIAENDNYSLRVFLWNSFADMEAYANVKIY